MCGIAGYAGGQNAKEKVFDMLKRLEYRGYDSAGIALLDSGITIFKDKGKVSEIKENSPSCSDATTGIGHSRWATHGEPSHDNAHPHTDCTGGIAIVHNGIIENYAELRERLMRKGHKFASETDSEAISHLIEEGMAGSDIETAFRNALKQLEGSFAILAVCEKAPGKIFFARNESPLLIGLGSGANYLASDMPAILPETRKAIILDDLEYGVLTKDKAVVRSIKTGKEVKKQVHTSDLTIEAAEKGGYAHFMLKEMLEESAAVKNALKSRPAAREIAKKLKGCDSFYFIACGTAYHAGVAARYMMQEYGLPSFADVASEFRYSAVKGAGKKTAVILISQSGETADTLAAAKEAKKRGAKVVSIVNVVGSSLTRVSDANMYTYSGPEIAVASTKAYLGQVTALFVLSLEILLAKGLISKGEAGKLSRELDDIPSKIDGILDSREMLKGLSQSLSGINDFFYIARRLNYPTALEGALKLKEISYLHAEAYPGGELKHGPLALMEESVCVVALNPDDGLQKKMDSNIQEVKSRKARVLEITEGGSFGVSKDASGFKVSVPKTSPVLTPLTMIVPLHLLAYYIALSKGLDIDKPRNLAKSVTVE